VVVPCKPIVPKKDGMVENGSGNQERRVVLRYEKTSQSVRQEPDSTQGNRVLGYLGARGVFQVEECNVEETQWTRS